MYQILTFLIGAILAVMIMVNGDLSARYGIFVAAAIIHVIGSLFALFVCTFQKEKKALWHHQPMWIYLGGAIGVLTTLFNNFAYEKISMTSIVALGLLGQIIMSMLIDYFGLFGMERQIIHKKSLWAYLWGGLFALLGILAMLDNTVTEAAYAIGFSLCAGVTVVLSRTVNARLAEKVGSLKGSLINHFVGLPITVILAFIIIIRNRTDIDVSFGLPLWIYCGGVLGVVTVLLNNIVVPKIPAFYLTSFSFVGQVFASILLDVFFGNSYSDTTLIGGILVAIGITISMVMEWQAEHKAQREKEYWNRIKKANQKYQEYIMKKYSND